MTELVACLTDCNAPEKAAIWKYFFHLFFFVLFSHVIVATLLPDEECMWCIDMQQVRNEMV